MFRRVLSILLCGCMLAGSLPVTGFAAQEQAMGTEAESENAGGGYVDDAPTQLKEDADASDMAENKDSADLGNKRETEITKEETKTEAAKTETAREDGEKENETPAETKADKDINVFEEADKTEPAAENKPEQEKESAKADEDTDVPEDVREPEPATEEMAAPQSQPEETDADEAAVNQAESSEAATAVIKQVQACGYYIAADIEITDTDSSKYYHLYWKEIGTGEYQKEDYVSDGERIALCPVKPNTAYVMELRSATGDTEQVLDEKEITTTDDYNFKTSVSVINVTTNSAEIEVAFTDYQGAFANEDYSGFYTQLLAMTEYTDVWGVVHQEKNYSDTFRPDAEDKAYTVHIPLSGLQAGTSYTLPVWVAEYVNRSDNDSDAIRKKLDDVTFTTLESDIAEKLQFQAELDGTDKTKINFTTSLSDSGTLTAESYDYTLRCSVKGAPVNEIVTVQGRRILQANGYVDQGSLSNLYAGTEYGLVAFVDGVIKTVEVSTGADADGVTPVISLSPLSLGGKLHIKLEGTPKEGDSYRVAVQVKDRYDSWGGLSYKTKTGSNLSNGVELTSENNYQGEWLVYSESYIGAGGSYEIKTRLYKNDNTTPIGSKYFTLDTPPISLQLGTGEIKGKSADITYEIVNPDEFFEWNSSGFAKLYYRVKGSEAEWEACNSLIYLRNSGTSSAKLENLAANTEYEVKITSYSDENLIYGTATFRTAEGMAKGTFTDLKAQFSGFNVGISGDYQSSDYAEQTELYLVEKDSADKVLAETQFYYYGSRVSVNSALHMKTAKVQVKAVETLGEQDEQGNPVKKEYFSEEYVRGNVPDVTFGISNVGTGVSMFHADLTYTGNMYLGKDGQAIRAALYYGKSGEDIGASPKTASVYYYDSSSKTQRLDFGGLTANTEYHGKLVVYVENNGGEKVYEQEIALDDFTTKENKTYPLESTFPDARLRELIISRASLGSSATEITAEQLEKITYLSANRRDFDAEPIKDLTGIELLTELTSLSLQNNEISDTPAVDWSKLTGLESLYLTGNELTKIPDLSKNINLNSLTLDENLIPAEEFASASQKLPEGVTLSSDVQSSQRIGGVKIIAEETYYQRAGKSPLLVKVTGYKSGLPYQFRYLVDGNEITLPEKTWENIQYNTDTGLELGLHTLIVEMYEKDQKTDSKSIDFQMAEGGAFPQENPYRFAARQDRYYLNVYSDKKVSAAYMKKDDSIIAMGLDIPAPNTSSTEYRYKTLSNNGINLEGSEIYQNSVSLECIKYKNPDAGVYDLRVVYDDNTEETLQGVIEIIGKAYVEGGSIGYQYDSTGNYFYLSMDGYGFDASKLDYAFTYKGAQQAAEYVNAKETSNGYIVKFRKADAWMPKEGDGVEVKLTPKDGYDVAFDRDTFIVYISQGIYYCAYNEVSDKIEVGVTSNLKQENVTFKLVRYNSWGDASNQVNAVETVGVTPEVVAETISYLLPMKEGKVYQLPGGYYRLDMACGDCNDHEIFNIYAENSNYWSDDVYVREGADKAGFYYYSEIPFASDNKGDFRAELKGGTLASPLNAETIWTYSYFGGAWTTVGMNFGMSKLAQGNYTITLYHQNEPLSTHNVIVIPADKFVITSDTDYHPSATWIDDSSFRVYLETVNTAESDAFTVSLTDIFGNEAKGLNTEVMNRYSDSVYLKVTGLNKEDAYRYYYLKVTHNTLGEAYKPDRTTKYFADERGKYTSIGSNKYTYTSNDDRIAGIGMYSDIVYPVTVKIYKPYDTDVITSLTVNKGDLESGTSNPAYYYFKQSLIDALPDADVLYDIAVIDSNGQTTLWTERPIGLREGSVTSDWKVSPTQLSLSLDSEGTKTSTITVTGNKETPKFGSENPKVATVAADKSDKNKAVVTAVAEGTANITITVDKITKKVAVTVTKEPVKPTGISISAPKSVAADSKVEIDASVMPAGAWTQDSSITWTSSDSSVISIPAGSKGLAVEADALKAGTAVITASLDGTQFMASCEITVVKEVSGDEQDDIVKEIGTLYFLEGADSSLADIKLPEGWKWEEPTLKPTADNSHPVQDFWASYSKDDISFERCLDVHVSKLDEVSIVGKGTAELGKEALYTGVYRYTGADPGNGYEISWKWTLGDSFSAEEGADTKEGIRVKVLKGGTLSVKMTVKNTTTGKTVSADASLGISADKIPDSEPELANKKLTVYKNSTRHVPIGLVAKDGNSITAVKTDKTAFQTEQDENGEWLIWLADGSSYTKKTSETLMLTVTTEFGKEYTKQLGVTVDVTEITEKNVKFKQTRKPNAAYSDTDTVRAEFTVSSKYIIEDITTKDAANEKFAVKSYNPASGALVLEAKSDALDKDAKTYPAKVDVKVRDYGTWTLGVKVAVQNKKPSLKLGDAVILSGVNADASVALYNKKTEISCRDYAFTKIEGGGVTLTPEGSMLKVAYTGDNNGSYKVKIRKNTWAAGTEMELKGKISVLDPAKAKLGADFSKVTINTSEGYSDPVTVTVGIKGCGVTADLTAEPATDKDAQAITVDSLGAGKIRITPKDGAKKGGYKVAVNGSVNGTAVKGLSISVKLTDKAPDVKLSAKGSINLANREGTSIVYTPKLLNLPETFSVKGVRMDRTAEDSDFFSVKLTDEGKVMMTAVTGKKMDPKKKYKPVLIFTLSNGAALKTNGKFTASVKNKLPKVAVTPLNSALCTVGAGQRASYMLSAGNGYAISNVTTDDTNCKVTFDSMANTVYVSLSEGTGTVAGKKYTVPCTVYIKGADNTTKPLTVKLKAVVY